MARAAGRAPIIPVRNERYTSGEIAVGDGRRVYISRGERFTTQVRFCVRPEITLFTMRRTYASGRLMAPHGV